MALEDVTEAAVLAAVAEFDSLGRDRFLAEHAGSRRARRYFLEVAGRIYDSVAVVGRAHDLGPGAPGPAAGLDNGEKAVAERLRRLGFTVRIVRDPPWSWDEVVLVCALVETNGWRTVPRERHEVCGLSALVQSTAIHPLDGRPSDFRSPADVERKTHDLVSCLPGPGPSTGTHLDAAVVDAFRSRPEEMHGKAMAIATALREWGDGQHDLRDPDILDGATDEGRALLRTHLRRERKKGLRQRKIAQVRELGHPVACEACDFDFSAAYGERGADYIECHHRPPIHESPPTQTLLADLALVCSNCHRMIHRSTPWLTVEELSAIVRARRT